MYRPQRAIITPPGFRDETFAVPVTGSQFGTLASGQQVTNIPIQLDRDYPFFWCGIAFATNTVSPIGFRFRDAWGVYLSDDYCTATLYAYPANSGAFGGGFIPLFEPALLCPAGSIPLVDLANLSTDGSSSAVFDFELRGFKRVQVC